MSSAPYLSGIFSCALWCITINNISSLLVRNLYFSDRTNTLAAYLITPAMGSHFVMYLAKMQGLMANLLVSSPTNGFQSFNNYNLLHLFDNLLYMLYPLQKIHNLDSQQMMLRGLNLFLLLSVDFKPQVPGLESGLNTMLKNTRERWDSSDLYCSSSE